MPAIVIARGRVVLDEEGVHAEQGWGRYIPAKPNSTFVYGRVQARDQVYNCLVNQLTKLVLVF